MEIKEIKATLAGHKGQNLKAVWIRPMKTRAAFKSTNITKLTSAVIRGGVDYDNLKTTIEGRADGSLPAENAGLPWGEWAEFPFHITHKERDYVRLYPASGLEFTPKTMYFIDGEQATKEQVQDMCLASEFKVSEPPTCFTLKADSIVTIG